MSQQRVCYSPPCVHVCLYVGIRFSSRSQTTSHSINSIHSQEMYQLSQYLQEALHREQVSLLQSFYSNFPSCLSIGSLLSPATSFLILIPSSHSSLQHLALSSSWAHCFAPFLIFASISLFLVTSCSLFSHTHSCISVFGTFDWFSCCCFWFQILQDKMSQLQTLLHSTSEACDASWHALINEDRLLSKLEVLQNQLSVFSKVSWLPIAVISMYYCDAMQTMNRIWC